MRSIGRIASAGAAAIAILAASMVTASTASAAVGDQKCNSVDGGVLCIRQYSNGYNIWFTNKTMQAKRVDFRLHTEDRANGYTLYDQGPSGRCPRQRTRTSFRPGHGLWPRLSWWISRPGPSTRVRQLLGSDGFSA